MKYEIKYVSHLESKRYNYVLLTYKFCEKRNIIVENSKLVSRKLRLIALIAITECGYNQIANKK